MNGENKIIAKIMEDARMRGFEPRIRDIAYAVLRAKFEDSTIAYAVVFEQSKSDKAVVDYDKQPMIQYLVRQMIKDNHAEDVPKIEEQMAEIEATQNAAQGADITFEENKAAMVELISRTETALEDGTIDVDKGLKIIADLRVKLNDKFGATDKAAAQYIFVKPKYNMICPHTHRECWQIDKEFAKEKFNLVEK